MTDARGRTPECLPFCLGGWHEAECPVVATRDIQPEGPALPHPDCDPLRHSIHGRGTPSAGCPACVRATVTSPGVGDADG